MDMYEDMLLDLRMHSILTPIYVLPMTLSGNCVDGFSITYGSPPSHLWTYVAGLNEISTGK